MTDPENTAGVDAVNLDVELVAHHDEPAAVVELATPLNAEECAALAEAHGWTWDGAILVHHEGFPVHETSFERAVNRMAGRPVE